MKQKKHRLKVLFPCNAYCFKSNLCVLINRKSVSFSLRLWGKSLQTIAVLTKVLYQAFILFFADGLKHICCHTFEVPVGFPAPFSAGT